MVAKKGHAPQTKVTVKEGWKNAASKSNAFKTGKYAKILTAQCNYCYLRSVDAGGNGKCGEYEADAVCSIDKDLKKAIDKFDTRNTNDIKEMLNETAKDLMRRCKMSVMQSIMDGNIIDQMYIKNQNALLNTLKLANDLNQKVKVEINRMDTFDSRGDFKSIMQSVRAEKFGDDVNNA